MAFIGKNQLFRAKVGVDESFELFPVLFISLQSKACDLQDMAMSTDRKKKS
jgi:hypothetical protein